MPAWAYTERDADDADGSIGALYENGETESVTLDPTPWNIISNTTISASSFNRNDVFIKNGGKLTVTGELRFLPGAGLKIESGGTLEIDGGKVVNASLVIEPGATLKIKNYGQLVLLPFGQEYFEVPLGAIFELERGDIVKSSVEFVTFI